MSAKRTRMRDDFLEAQIIYPINEPFVQEAENARAKRKRSDQSPM